MPQVHLAVITFIYMKFNVGLTNRLSFGKRVSDAQNITNDIWSVNVYHQWLLNYISVPCSVQNLEMIGAERDVMGDWYFVRFKWISGGYPVLQQPLSYQHKTRWSRNALYPGAVGPGGWSLAKKLPTNCDQRRIRWFTNWRILHAKFQGNFNSPHKVTHGECTIYRFSRL